MAYFGVPQYGYPQYTMPMPDQLTQLRGGYNQPPMQQGAFQQAPQMPQMGQMQAMSQESPPMIWVQGEAGAKAHIVAPGNTVVLWDSENPIIYIKSADANGMPSMRIIDWKERSASAPPVMQPNAAQNVQYVTVDEYNKLAAVVNDLTAKLNAMMTQNAQRGENNAESAV
nr:MAG TPA: hypothetical protein [Caudoviricetes sp.]